MINVEEAAVGIGSQLARRNANFLIAPGDVCVFSDDSYLKLATFPDGTVTTDNPPFRFSSEDLTDIIDMQLAKLNTMGIATQSERVLDHLMTIGSIFLVSGAGESDTTDFTNYVKYPTSFFDPRKPHLVFGNVDGFYQLFL